MGEPTDGAERPDSRREPPSARNLREWLQEGERLKQLSLRAKLEIAARVAESLAALHKAGYPHGNLRPENILVDERPPTVKDIAPGVRLIQPGTPGSSAEPLGMYLAPELRGGKPPTFDGDLYSLGVVTFQTVVADLGRAPDAKWKRHVDEALVRRALKPLLTPDPASRASSGLEAAAAFRLWWKNEVTEMVVGGLGCLLLVGFAIFAGIEAAAQLAAGESMEVVVRGLIKRIIKVLVRIIC